MSELDLYKMDLGDREIEFLANALKENKVKSAFTFLSYIFV